MMRDMAAEIHLYSFLVNSSNSNFTYHYAAVLSDGSHSAGEHTIQN